MKEHFLMQESEPAFKLWEHVSLYLTVAFWGGALSRLKVEYALWLSVLLSWVWQSIYILAPEI